MTVGTTKYFKLPPKSLSHQWLRVLMRVVCPPPAQCCSVLLPSAPTLHRLIRTRAQKYIGFRTRCTTGSLTVGSMPKEIWWLEIYGNSEAQVSTNVEQQCLSKLRMSSEVPRSWTRTVLRPCLSYRSSFSPLNMSFPTSVNTCRSPPFARIQPTELSALTSIGQMARCASASQRSNAMLITKTLPRQTTAFAPVASTTTQRAAVSPEARALSLTILSTWCTKRKQKTTRRLEPGVAAGCGQKCPQLLYVSLRMPQMDPDRTSPRTR